VRQRLTAARGAAAHVAATVLSTGGLRGSALELAWWGSHIAMWPFGLWRETRDEDPTRLGLDGLDPIKRGLLIGNVEAAGTPIVLLHGIVDNRSIFTVLRRSLRRRGFGRVVTLNYGVVTADVRSLAEMLALRVEQLCQETGYERVHVVGHSLGGLVARYYVQRLGGDARVHTLVTLGTPHEGTYVAHAVPHRLCRQLRPGSDLMRELRGPAYGCRTRFVCLYSDMDQIIVPHSSGRLEHPNLVTRNVLVSGVGHLSLPIHGRVVQEICTTLAFLDHQGSTVAAGVTSITSDSGRTRRRGTTRRGSSRSAASALSS
jgi:pimeloyl-ACP methyl ester carboxylesterase